MITADPKITEQCQAEINAIKPTGTTHDFTEQGWGHRCCFEEKLNERKARFMGWADPIPVPGDTFLRITKSGGIARYFVTKSTPANSGISIHELAPTDMFYLEAIQLGNA